MLPDNEHQPATRAAGGKRSFRDAYMGQFNNTIEFIQELFGQQEKYFDYEMLWNDLERGGEYWEDDGYFFRAL
jgi:hypothetical protein